MSTPGLFSRRRVSSAAFSHTLPLSRAYRCPTHPSSRLPPPAHPPRKVNPAPAPARSPAMPLRGPLTCFEHSPGPEAPPLHLGFAGCTAMRASLACTLLPPSRHPRVRLALLGLSWASRGRSVAAPPPPAPAAPASLCVHFTHHRRCLPPHPTPADTMVLSQQISVSLSIIALCGLIGAGVAVGSGVGEPACTVGVSLTDDCLGQLQPVLNVSLYPTLIPPPPLQATLSQLLSSNPSNPNPKASHHGFQHIGSLR